MARYKPNSPFPVATDQQLLSLTPRDAAAIELKQAEDHAAAEHPLMRTRRERTEGFDIREPGPLQVASYKRNQPGYARQFLGQRCARDVALDTFQKLRREHRNPQHHWISVVDLAEICHVSRNGIQQAVSRLRKDGYLIETQPSQKRRFGQVEGHPTMYRLKAMRKRYQTRFEL